MSKAMIGPLIVGVLGVAALLGLGSWQLERHVWKQGVLSEIEAQIGASPAALPVSPDPQEHRYLSVVVRGRLLAKEIHVLASNKDTGAGYRVIAVMLTGDGRRILVDRGFVPIAAKDSPRPARDITVSGNLHWPDEVDAYTPPPDLVAEIWFARDVPALAAALRTEPVLIVARQNTADGVVAFPVASTAIPNNHLGYAITWFLLAGVWFGMTVILVLRIKRRADQ